MYFNTNAGLRPLVVSDEILHEALDVMSGELTSVHGQGRQACSFCERIGVGVASAARAV